MSLPLFGGVAATTAFRGDYMAAPCSSQEETPVSLRMAGQPRLPWTGARGAERRGLRSLFSSPMSRDSVILQAILAYSLQLGT